VVVWGRQPAPAGRPVIRLEDGFLRSVGLGADLVRPLSWVVDDTGIYYDTRHPSRLTQLLLDTDFDPALCERAARLRHSILGAGLSKYNLGGRLWQRPAAAAGRPVVLVVGQVETDAAIRHGAPGVCTNLALVQAARADRPEAWLIYKPHPDVVARLRARGAGEQDIPHHCDEVLSDVAIESLLPQVDGVQVMTSLAGFEALLRGIPLTVWGCPFYAGWGLSDDRHPQPGPRRPLTLDALVAGVLILYPRYVSRVSHAFCSPECALQELLAWRDRDRSQPVPWRQALFMRAKRAVLRAAAWWRARHPA
jgi:capsular polysaccharide export protein